MKVRRLRKYRFSRTGELVTFETKSYYVTDEGQVYDGDRHKYVAQCEIHGYLKVNLFDDNGQKHTSVNVHGLVASTFLRLLQKGEVVHHIDKNRKNNNLYNLEIIDESEHSRRHTYEKWKNGTFDSNGDKLKNAWKDGRYDASRKKMRNVGTSRPAKQVAQIDMGGRLLKVWPSTAETGRNGYNIGNVAACCRNCYMRQGNSIYKGFKWQYLSDYQEEGTNLEIIDGGEQQWMNWQDGRNKARNVGNSYRPARQVAQIDMDGKLLKVWPSASEAGRNGFHQGSISRCCRNCFNRPGNNVYKGFKWMYMSDYLAQHDTETVESQPVQLEMDTSATSV